MTELHIELGCLGYYGFGSGYDRGRRDLEYSHEKAYCGKACPLAVACWEKHIERTRTLLPALAADFAELEHTSQGRAVPAFEVLHGRPNPYTTLMMGNVEDGERVALGGIPLWRGDCTLPWPLVEN